MQCPKWFSHSMAFFEPVLRLTPRAIWKCLIVLICPYDVLYTMSLAIESTTRFTRLDVFFS